MLLCIVEYLEYSEYDFRNLQALEALEDSYWESNYSSLLHDDYMLTRNNVLSSETFNKIQTLYNDCMCSYMIA